MYPQQFPGQWQLQSSEADFWPSTALEPPPTMAFVEPISAVPPMVPLPAYTTIVAEPKPSVPHSTSPVDGPSGKVRRPRATLACEQCRTRKQRCDEGEPCTFCRTNDLNCSYRPLLPGKVDKVVEYMLSWVSTHAEGLRLLTEKIESLEECIRTRATKEDESAAQTRAMPALRRQSSSPRSILFWPEVRKLFAASGIQCDPSYMSRAEETHVPLHTGTGLGQDGSDVTISACAINTLHQAFLADIWPSYPFLDRGRLSSTMEAFSRAHASDYLLPERLRSADSNDEPPAKRIRLSPRASSSSVERNIEYSPHNAIALLILALGEMIVDGRALHMKRDTSSLQVPGWAYYATANRIMSAHIDGSSLAHAQMFLLAGMYKARLGRLTESASWYSMAGRVLLHLLRRHDVCQEQSRKSNSDLRTREGQILAATWCCLRLEKSALSELHLPQSGLQDLQNVLPLPALPPDVGYGSEHMGVFQMFRASCQLYTLRSHIDEFLDGPRTSTGADISTIMKQHAAELQAWRAKLVSTHWDDTDAPPDATEHAQLRYGYYSIKLDILSPFLDYVLHILPGLRLGLDLDSCSLDANGHLRPGSERRLISAINLMATESGVEEVLCLAELAVDALNHKLAAFRGICATAYSGMIHISHEQFHDLLLLTSVHRSDCLNTSVSAASLQQAYAHTCDLLGKMAAISPICKEDHKILNRIRYALVDSSLAASDT